MEDKSDLTFPDNSDSQGILVYYEIGSWKFDTNSLKLIIT